MKVRKERSLFWKIYRIVLIVAFALVAVGLIYLTTVLKDYEAVQPKHVAKEVFDTYFKNFNAEEYAKTCVSDGGFESEEDIAAALKSVTEGKEIKYYRVSSGMEKSFKYIVKADDTKFASFKLVEDKDAGTRFTSYKATDFQLYVNTGKGVTVEVPAGYKLFVNDIQVGEDKITEKDVKTEESLHIPDDVKPISYNKYTVSGLMKDPTVKVTDGSGKEATVDKTGDSTYKAYPVSDTALKEQYHAWILKGMKRYAEYMQHSSNNPVSFREISVYFDPSSDLYEDIKTEENMFVWDYDSVEYENDVTDNYIKYDDNTFSCRVAFVQILHKSGKDDYKDHLDLTLYLRRVGDEFLIYDMAQN